MEIKDEILGALKSYADQTGQKLAELDARQSAVEQLVVRSGGGTGTDTVPELFKQFTDDPRFEQLCDGAQTTGRVTLKGATLPSLIKTALVSIQGGGGAGSFDVEPQRASEIYNDPRRRLTLLEVLPRLPVSSNTYEFNRLDGYVNNADFQSEEGADKQETAVPTDLVTVPIATIAHFLPTSRQLLSDVASLQQRIGSLMTYGVLAKYEQAVVSGDGTAGGILGLVPQATPFSATYTDPVERIGEAIATLESLGWIPGAVLMHPLDWFAIRSARADGGTGEYLAGGWSSPASPNAWNVPVMSTPSMPRGEALVMDPAQVALLDRMAPSIMLGMVDKQFTKNMLTMLGELRAGLAVYAPASILLVSLEASS